MKNTRLPALLLFTIIGFSTLAPAMDLTGIDLKEIPIPQSQADREERSIILATPQISAHEWVQMSPKEQALIALRLRELDLLQQAYLQKKAKDEQQEDVRVNPDHLCELKFGKGYSYTGRVQREGPNGVLQQSYVCASFGPSKRTPFEKHMIQIEGYLLFVRFKIFHPLTAWPG